MSAPDSHIPSSRKRPRITGATIRTWLPLMLIAVAIIGAPIRIFAADGLPRLKAVESELHGVERENEQMMSEIARLRARVLRIRQDPKTIERLARDDLGLVRNNEVIFQFPRN
jgi:cell division protein FtsB